MNGIEWQNTFNTYIPEVDLQHKKLVALINNLQKAVDDNRGEEETGSLLRSMVEYAKVHFSTEEKIMKEMEYPHLLQHKKLHDDFKKKVESFLLRLKDGEHLNPYELLSFLKDWLINHIVKEDKRLGQSYVARIKMGKKTAPAG